MGSASPGSPSDAPEVPPDPGVSPTIPEPAPALPAAALGAPAAALPEAPPLPGALAAPGNGSCSGGCPSRVPSSDVGELPIVATAEIAPAEPPVALFGRSA